MDVKGVLSSWLTADTKSCCCRARFNCFMPSTYKAINPPHRIKISMIDNHMITEAPGPAGKLLTLNINSIFSSVEDNLFCSNKEPSRVLLLLFLINLEYVLRLLLFSNVDKIFP